MGSPRLLCQVLLFISVVCFCKEKSRLLFSVKTLLSVMNFLYLDTVLIWWWYKISLKKWLWFKSAIQEMEKQLIFKICDLLEVMTILRVMSMATMGFLYILPRNWLRDTLILKIIFLSNTSYQSLVIRDAFTHGKIMMVGSWCKVRVRIRPMYGKPWKRIIRQGTMWMMGSWSKEKDR